MVLNQNSRMLTAVCVETEKFRGLFLPEFGCRMVSLEDKENEYELFAQDAADKFIPLTYDGGYVEAEVSGFDDMFPTIDPFVGGGKAYPCHGEMCRVRHEWEITEDMLNTSFVSEVFG